MKNIYLTVFFLIAGIACYAQAVGRIYFRDNPMDVPSGKPDRLEFGASDADLSESSKEYLQYMLDQYGSAITSKTGVKIVIEPASSTQKEESEKVAMKRIQSIEKFLKKTNVKPHKTNFTNQVITIRLASAKEKA